MSITKTLRKPALVLVGLIGGALAYTTLDAYTQLEFASESQCADTGGQLQLSSTLTSDLLRAAASSAELAEVEREAQRLVNLHQAALKNLVADARWESADQRVGLSVAVAQTREELDVQQQRMLRAQQQRLALASR